MKRYIIDVGTSSTAPKGRMLKSLYNLPVIFIEPNQSDLNQVYASTDDIKVNAAITSYDGFIEFNYYQDGTHSILKTNIDEIYKYIDGYTGQPAEISKWSAWKTEKVQCYKLSTILDMFGVDQVAYLKIDTQGHDFEVIKSLGEKINVVEVIECEVQVTDFEIYKNQSNKTELVKYMIDHGFFLRSVESQTYNQEENLVFEKTPI